jgi:hypothetical protein
MSDYQYPVVPAAAVETGPGLSQIQRVIYTFTAPSKTFDDIRDRNRSWWLPFLLVVVFVYIFFFAVTTKVTWTQVAENNAKMSTRQTEQLDKLPPDQRATQIKYIAYGTEGFFAATPILAIIFQLIIAGVLMATINFGFGGKATFSEVFSVCWYAGLPGLLKFILGTLALFVGIEPEAFKLNNFDGTNLGYYLPAETSKPLLALATSIDILTIWSIVLTAIGLAIVAKTKRSSGYIAVFGWWVLIVLIGVGVAAAFA